MNKKGIESFPFFLFLTVLIAAFILVLGSYLVQNATELFSKKEAADSYEKLMNAAEDLKATADTGSFTRVQIKIPPGYALEFANNGEKNDTISLKHGEEIVTNTATFDITNLTFENVLESGTYEIVVYYGALRNETYQPYAMYFK